MRRLRLFSLFVAALVLGLIIEGCEVPSQKTIEGRYTASYTDEICQWTITFELQNFTPNSPITHDTAGNGYNCDGQPQNVSSTGVVAGITDNNGNLVFTDQYLGTEATLAHTFYDNAGNSIQFDMELELELVITEFEVRYEISFADVCPQSLSFQLIGFTPNSPVSVKVEGSGYSCDGQPKNISLTQEVGQTDAQGYLAGFIFNQDGHGVYSYTFSDSESKVIETIFPRDLLDPPAYETAFLTDEQLTDYTSINEAQIREFFVNQNSYFSQPVPDVDGEIFDAATVIAQAANQYQINPKVILATLQKETSGVTRSDAPNLEALMGCSGASDVLPVPEHTGRWQIWCAAERFRAYHNALIGGGKTPSGRYEGETWITEDGVMITNVTKAIAGQFTYTPFAGGQWGGQSHPECVGWPEDKCGGVYLFYQAWQSFGFGN